MNIQEISFLLNFFFFIKFTLSWPRQAVGSVFWADVFTNMLHILTFRVYNVTQAENNIEVQVPEAG